MQIAVKMSFKGKTSGKTNGQNIYGFEKEIDPALGLYTYMYTYVNIIVKQIYWYISQISGERLQDHWSSGFETTAAWQMQTTNEVNKGMCVFKVKVIS